MSHYIWTYKNSTDFLNKYHNINYELFNQIHYENQDGSNKPIDYCRNQQGMEYTNLDELGRVSSRLLRLLDKTRKEHDKNSVWSDDVFSLGRGSVNTTTPLDYNAKDYDREQRKKDNHRIKRRRRFYINSTIHELETLLPYHTDTSTRRNKGSVIKATVEYIKKLKKDQERFKEIEEKLKRSELQYKRLMSRLKSLKSTVKAIGM